MNFASNTASRVLDQAVEGCGHPAVDRMLNPALDVGDDAPGVALVPGTVERLGGDAELDDEIVAQIFRLGLAALFLPQPDQRGFVAAHDDPGVRAAKKMAAAIMLSCGHFAVHDFLRAVEMMLSRFGTSALERPS